MGSPYVCLAQEAQSVCTEGTMGSNGSLMGMHRKPYKYASALRAAVESLCAAMEAL